MAGEKYFKDSATNAALPPLEIHKYMNIDSVNMETPILRFEMNIKLSIIHKSI